jgi:tetratricopeptide (TPR) repeat protein
MNLKLLIFAGLFLGLETTAFCGTADEHILSGSKFAQEKKYQEAAREFEVAVQEDPENADARLLLGLTLANTGELDKAVQSTLKAIQLRPSYAAYYNLGLIYSNQNAFEDAVKAYEQAVILNPTSYQAWHQLGKVHASALDFKKAIQAYQKTVDLNPKFPDAYQGLGSAYYWSGDLASALQQVDALNKLHFENKAIELNDWIENKETKKRIPAAGKPASPKRA